MHIIGLAPLGSFFYSRKSLDMAGRVGDSQSRASSLPTRLSIPFASSGSMLEQTLLSYVAEGWPLSEIVVVDNTGSSRDNLHGLLSSDDHTSLNYSRLLQKYGVSIYRLPTRQSFAQLQNFLLELAVESQWRDIYVSHQDVVVRRRTNSTLSMYQHILTDRTSTAPRALTWFNYDWLSRVNVHAAVEI